jgi:CRISP-associated protein Cas1
MTNRILDFANMATTLSLRNGLMQISGEGVDERIPVKDIAVVIASHPSVTFTQALVAELAVEGGVLICCNRRHHPVAMLQPLDHHHQQTEKYRLQALAPVPVQKRIWKEVVRAKIHAQGTALQSLNGSDSGLLPLAKRVRSGDNGNLEAVAAQRYWPRLFGDSKFRRGDENDGRNALLNYGYAIVRAIAARAISGAGLHPTLGVHHKNRANPFCLADDLMEPCRPLVDRGVVDFVLNHEEEEWVLERKQKELLIDCAIARYRVGNESRTLFDILTRTAQLLASTLTGEMRVLQYPLIDVSPTF